MKLIYTSGLWALAALALAGCRNIPDYPDTPRITFDSVEHSVVEVANAQHDRLIFKVKFTDGDGDLGLTSADTLGPFRRFISATPDTTINGAPARRINLDYYNWMLRFYRKVNGQFVPFQFPFYGLDYNGRFPVLTPEDKKGPLDGTISQRVDLLQLNFQPNDTFRFEIQIKDRKLNRSNWVRSSEVVLRKQ